jgi:acyl-CoA thioester hydrolase
MLRRSDTILDRRSNFRAQKGLDPLKYPVNAKSEPINPQKGIEVPLFNMPDKTIQFEHRFRVGWSDLDGNAHMGNSAYLDQVSNTRMLFFARHGFSIERFASEKFGPVVVRDELVYRKELRLMDEFTVDFESVGISNDGVRFRVRNTFRNNAGEVAASVTSEGVWFDLENRRPRNPPKDLDDLMRSLHRSLDFKEIPRRNSV